MNRNKKMGVFSLIKHHQCTSLIKRPPPSSARPLKLNEHVHDAVPRVLEGRRKTQILLAPGLECRGRERRAEGHVQREVAAVRVSASGQVHSKSAKEKLVRAG